MPEYSSPGVFVEEISDSSLPIAPCRTSVSAFVGHLPDVGLAIKTPIRVLENGLTRVRYMDWPDCRLKRAIEGFFQNGGKDLWVLGLDADVTEVDGMYLGLLDDQLEINLLAAPGFVDVASHTALIAHCEQHGQRFAVLDGPEQVDNATVFATEPLAPSGQAALYVPWLQVPGRDEALPPSGHVCGIYARMDEQRGVWAAPVNFPMDGVVGLTQSLSNDDQEGLNTLNVNAIRSFDARGIMMWGARTRAPAGHDMRYVPERRLMNMLEASLTKGIQWAVFHPNSTETWMQVRTSVEAFLTLVWQSGGVVGETAEQAFFTRCGPETMTQSDLDQGRLICEVGVATQRPAEFSILRLEVQTADPEPDPPTE
ncbi:Phage tail sheath protein [Falsiruegeria litorea R37]|uniref:Phage tail sheath protein n=1 Tax=Falsiruegeria litorea R37 TaxID=1200284 RepID=A0A1Y5SR30_9RHOB|nr:phage tail sheath subtilisin-like domain-containing protein [Falsiruegeria litorea]SLN46477.1 Phage tail sheath protein [Falsiruegeria litorea R37]